jgi:hypothetical protein
VIRLQVFSSTGFAFVILVGGDRGRLVFSFLVIRRSSRAFARRTSPPRIGWSVDRSLPCRARRVYSSTCLPASVVTSRRSPWLSPR